MEAPPPPPPPHGQNPGGTGSRARGGLPDGNYDIFIIPPHSAGSGFLYLPSLQPHRNSFIAGVFCALLAVAIWSICLPVLREWFATIVASGGAGVILLLVAVGVAGWAWGKTQVETTKPGGGNTGGAASGSGFRSANPEGASSGNSGSPPHTDPPPQHQYQPPPQPPPRPQPSAPPPKPTWQRSAPTGEDAKTSWEKAREETRKKEEERKKAEDLKKRAEELRKKREEEEKKRVEQREKDAKEREAREAKEKREREIKERIAARKAAEAASASASASQAASQTQTQSPRSQAPRPQSRPASPTKPPYPSAKTATSGDDAYSYRPYDSPPKQTSNHKSAKSSGSVYSASSYAASQSTARTTPPPSHRGPYTTKDPDKIVLKAVYSFNHAFSKTPIAQLVSHQGTVTDGLILRITTEGLFIDDDVRGVPQREWDVKAWTMKLVEVWCPSVLALGASSGSDRTYAILNPSAVSGRAGAASAGRTAFFSSSAKKDKPPTSEETDAYLAKLLPFCKSHCCDAMADGSSEWQSGEYKGLHVLRANIRDSEGKRYVFVLQEEEGWKVAVGLQRLRRGTQVRALGVSGMSSAEAKVVLEGMGWV